jgi:hypothetical protein
LMKYVIKIGIQSRWKLSFSEEGFSGLLHGEGNARVARTRYQ